jgi:hypothetical protein
MADVCVPWCFRYVLRLPSYMCVVSRLQLSGPEVLALRAEEINAIASNCPEHAEVHTFEF